MKYSRPDLSSLSQSSVGENPATHVAEGGVSSNLVNTPPSPVTTTSVVDLSSMDPLLLMRSEEERTVLRKAELSFLNQIIVSTCKLELMKDPDALNARYSPVGQQILARYNQLSSFSKSKIPSKDRLGYFVTINPPFQGLDFDEVLELGAGLIDRTLKFIERKTWIVDYIFCVEQIDGTHPHVHMLVLLDPDNRSVGEPSRFRKCVESSYERFFGPTPMNNTNVKIKGVNASYLPNCVNYIKGIKAPKEGKPPYDPEQDQAFRAALSAPPFFTEREDWL